MIRITNQSGTNQYDSQGNAITSWDDKKGAWIVNPEYENEEINWWGSDNDFPAGYTLKEYEASHPGWERLPDISVTWFWDTKLACVKAFGSPYSFGADRDYWDKIRYPYTCTRSWGDLDFSKGQAVNALGTYCSFHKHADRVIVRYNGETLHDGKLVV